MAKRNPAAGFTAFPAPVGDPQDDIPLVRPGRDGYVCTGCGGTVLDGQVLLPQVRDGDDGPTVVGLVARGGREPDAPVTHQCGEVVG